jgi:manganese/zinc/iron transport system permease protein
MLIIPGATAYLLVKRLKSMLILAGLLGLVSGALGAFISYILAGVPTGPVMVLIAATIFFVVFLFSPTEGLVLKALRRRQRSKRIRRENVLKNLAEYFEEKAWKEEFVPLSAFSKFAEIEERDLLKTLRELASSGELSVDATGRIKLNPSGVEEGKRVLRNHVLWEIYLSEFTDIAHDHVHYDAERIEHILTPEMVKHLEEILAHQPIGTTDPSRGGR